MRLAVRAAAPVVLAALTAACAGLAPPRPEVAARLDGITPEALEFRVRALCALGPRPAADAEATGRVIDHLAAALRELGYEPHLERFETELTVTESSTDEQGRTTFMTRPETRTLVNLVAERRGTDRPDIVVEVAAHYDTVGGTVGADDNASGVALVLEAARVLAQAPVRRTVRFCLFAAEEPGLLGSTEHVRRLPPFFDGVHDGALVADMVGYASREPGSQDFPVRLPLLVDPPRTGDFVFLVGDWDSSALADHFERCAARYAPGLSTWGIKRLAGLSDASGRSDHASYWRDDRRAILLNDTADLRSPHYHAPSDVPETLDYAFLAQVTRAACAWTLERADLPVDPGMIGDP